MAEKIRKKLASILLIDDSEPNNYLHTLVIEERIPDCHYLTFFYFHHVPISCSIGCLCML